VLRHALLPVQVLLTKLAGGTSKTVKVLLEASIDSMVGTGTGTY
jgi:hypothetical protein